MNTFFTVLKNKNFRSLWLAQITSQIALNMLIFVLGIQVYSHTRSNTSVSLILLSFGLPSIFFGIPAGSIVDFYDKKKVLTYCNLFRAVLLFLFFLFSDQILVLYLLAIITSIITQFFIPAEAPSIPSLVSPNELLSANSLFTISLYFSKIFGFILAGPAVSLLGTSGVYIFMMILMLLATYFVTKLPEITVPKPKRSSPISAVVILDSIVVGLKFIKHHKRVGQSLVILTGSQALISVLVVLAPGFADKIVKVALTDASYLVMGPAALGLVLGAYWVGKYGEKYLKGKIIRTGILSIGTILVILYFFARLQNLLTIPPIAIFFILLIGVGFFTSLLNVPASTILQQESESDVRGRVYGILTSLTGGGSVLPVVLSGILADLTSVTETGLVIGFITL